MSCLCIRPARRNGRNSRRCGRRHSGCRYHKTQTRKQAAKETLLGRKMHERQPLTDAYDIHAQAQGQSASSQRLAGRQQDPTKTEAEEVVSACLPCPLPGRRHPCRGTCSSPLHLHPAMLSPLRLRRPLPPSPSRFPPGLSTRALSAISIKKPVLIAGAGPVGLSLSALLSRYGVPNIVLEKSSGLSPHPQVSKD